MWQLIESDTMWIIWIVAAAICLAAHAFYWRKERIRLSQQTMCHDDDECEWGDDDDWDEYFDDDWDYYDDNAWCDLDEDEE